MEHCGFVFRWGGEEFLLIFENMTIEETRLCVQEFMDEVSASKIMWKDQEIMLTMTFGIAGIQEKDSLYKVIQLADSRLYKGKKQGRNRIIEGD